MNNLAGPMVDILAIASCGCRTRFKMEAASLNWPNPPPLYTRIECKHVGADEVRTFVFFELLLKAKRADLIYKEKERHKIQ